jgi:uncharacterized protein (DUF1778 family)
MCSNEREPVMSTPVKLERLEARIRPEDKRSLERAAELSGRKLTDFVVSAACEAARATIQRYEGMVLTDVRDREAFVAAMLTPVVPTEKLRAAAARYRKATDEHR